MQAAESRRAERATDSTERWGLAIAGLLTLVSLGVFGWISRYQSYVADDFSMMASLRGVGLSEFLVSTYDGWYGRVVPTLFTYIFLPRPNLYAIVNVMVLAACVVLAVRLGRDRWPDPRRPKDALLTLATLGAFWFGAPSADQTLLWRVGAFNYSWVLAVVLLFAIPYRRWLSDQARGDEGRDGLARVALMTLAGLAVGLTHEQAGALVGVLGLWFLGYVLRKRLLRQVPTHLYAGAIGVIVGFAVLIMAPGNQLRFEARVMAFSERLEGFAALMLKSFGQYWTGAYAWLLVLALLSLGISALRTDPSRRLRTAAAWFTGAASILLPLLWSAWATGPRSTFFTFAAVLIGILSLVQADERSTVDAAMTARSAIVGCLLIASLIAGDAGFEARASIQLNKHHGDRHAALMRGQGTEEDVVVRALPVPARRFQMRGELTADPEHWYNRAVAKYYGVKSVRIEQ